MDFNTWINRMQETINKNCVTQRISGKEDKYELEVELDGLRHIFLYSMTLKEAAEKLQDDEWMVTLTFIHKRADSSASTSCVQLVNKESGVEMSVYSRIFQKNKMEVVPNYFGVLSEAEKEKLRDLQKTLLTYEENFGPNRLAYLTGILILEK